MNPIEIPIKPRVLIADDSRIVRATLIKHIEGLFEFREALDGEQAWETLLIDPNIRVVITDLTMPKLDGYGLLQRIRASKISRIRNIPVVVVSGSVQQEERERAKAAGATDVIAKGISTEQFLSRLDILSRLVDTQREFECSLEELFRQATANSAIVLPSPEHLMSKAQLMLDSAIKHHKNFVLLTVGVGLKHAGLDGSPASPPASVVNAIGQLLQQTIRQTDCVARTGDAEFTLVTGSIHADAVRNFGQRVCHAVAHVDLIKDDRIAFVASCGLAAWPESAASVAGAPPTLADLRTTALRRTMLGMDHALSGVVVGAAEEEALKLEAGMFGALPASTLAAAEPVCRSGESVPDVATLLQWLKEGKRDQVLKHLGRLSVELQPLVDLMLEQGAH